MGGGRALRHAVVLLIEPEAVPVLLVLRQQGLVDDGHAHAPAGDSLLMEGPEAQAGVLPQLQKPLRVKVPRQALRPTGVGVEIRGVQRISQV